jgi:hypothetical protein
MNWSGKEVVIQPLGGAGDNEIVSLGIILRLPLFAVPPHYRERQKVHERKPVRRDFCILNLDAASLAEHSNYSGVKEWLVVGVANVQALIDLADLGPMSQGELAARDSSAVAVLDSTRQIFRLLAILCG